MDKNKSPSPFGQGDAHVALNMLQPPSSAEVKGYLEIGVLASPIISGSQQAVLRWIFTNLLSG